MKSSFQTILIGLFIASFIGAILIFAGVIKIGGSSSSTAVSGNVRIWGVYSQDVIQPYVEQLNIQNKTILTSYLQKNPETLRTELIEALANGTAPDLVIAGSGELFSFRDKLYTIPFATYNERLFRDSFVDGASIFLNKEGVLASPLLVDPLVIYYNKDLLAGQKYVTPPNTWTDLVKSLPLFLKKDSRGVITQTAIALGESSNISHFKEILSTLFLQTGNPVVSINNQTGLYEQRLTVSYSENADQIPTSTALDFYTSFANQANSLFSWSRTLPSSLDMFLSGKSAFYIGKASELFTIQSQNPNLNFDVTTMFQNDGATRPLTFGDFSGVGIIKSSPNFTASYNIVGALTSREFIQYLSGSLSIPSARRDLLLEAQQSPYVQVFFQAVLSAFGWPDINSSATDTIFRDMIRNVNSGAFNPIQAIYEASRDLQSIVR